jgi:uncharacterized protein
VGGTADGISSTNCFELDAKKNEQSKYGVDAAMSLQATCDAMRQELHRERNGRAKDKAALSLALEEAVARAVFAESVASDCRYRDPEIPHFSFFFV